MPKRKPTAAERLKADAAAKVQASLAPDALIALLRKGRITTEQICQKTGATDKQVIDAIATCVEDHHVLLNQFGDTWEISKAPPQHAGETDVYKSRKDGTYLFGFTGDQHLASKYERLDVLNDLYDEFAARGVDRVFNGGNWIEGEARFNKHDLLAHGMDAQLEYMAEHYPQRPGIVTYAVAGDDHEGWYGQREGIDIGKHAEDIMRRNGRTDWVHLGYMEAFTDMVHCKTGATARHLTMHPGGGSSYAISYRMQKIIESMDGGEKPAILGIAHYHKMCFIMERNVWAYQMATTKDQDIFMRKKSLAAHVGGGIIKATQDEETGAIVAFQIEYLRYFNREYYNNRWNNAGSVCQPPRSRRA